MLIAKLHQKRLIIDWLYIDPDERRKGLGEALLDEVFEISKAQETESIGLVAGGDEGDDQSL